MKITKEEITNAIYINLPSFLKRYKLEDPYDINCGHCEEFALEIISLLGGEDENFYANWIEDIHPNLRYHSHCVIVLKVENDYWYFDSECPEGVKDLKELPVVKNDGIDRKTVISSRP